MARLQVQVCYPYAMDGCQEAAYFLNHRQAVLTEALHLGRPTCAVADVADNDGASTTQEAVSVAGSTFGTSR